MSYFDEVYLKRINLHGNTRQERINYRKEKEFDDLFLKRTQYQANVYKINQNKSNIVVSLQPNKWNETKLVSNLLVSEQSEKFCVGDILKIYQRIGKEEYDKIWLTLFKEDNIGKGYQNYKLMCLDSTIIFANEYGDTQFVVPCKIVDNSFDNVEDLTLTTSSARGYREPNGERRFITRNFDFIKKDMYFEMNDKGYKVTGIDDASIKGVIFVTYAEQLYREPEPRSSEEIIVSNDTNFFLQNK